LSPGSALADSTLAERALSGDDSAFAQLIGRHKNWTFRFIRRYVGGSEDAYDVLQDTFFSAWLALGSYQPDRPFEFWLRRIALNKCRDRARREGVRRALRGLLHDDDTVANVVDASAGPERLAAADQEIRQMELALKGLPRSLKEPLLLTALEGLSHKEAGELLGLNAKAVEMRVYRARARLAELLRP
jgi:RNA polymerase sigma factor CnrH